MQTVLKCWIISRKYLAQGPRKNYSCMSHSFKLYCNQCNLTRQWFHFVIIVAWEIYLLRLLSISFNTFNLDSFAISLYLKIILKISTILEETKVKSI